MVKINQKEVTNLDFNRHLSLYDGSFDETTSRLEVVEEILKLVDVKLKLIMVTLNDRKMTIDTQVFDKSGTFEKEIRNHETLFERKMFKFVIGSPTAALRLIHSIVITSGETMNPFYDNLGKHDYNILIA